MSAFADFSFPVTVFPPGGRLGVNPGVTVELERIVPTGSVTHYLWMVGDGYEDILEALQTDPSLESMSVLEELGERALVRLRWRDVKTPLPELIEESGAALVDATGRAEGWTVTLRFPDEDALAEFYETCRQRGLALELQRIDDFELQGDFGLTPLQRETVDAAFEAGYFDVPRGATLADLAEQLGVSEQAVSERLRRGLRKFLVATLSDGQSSDADRD